MRYFKTKELADLYHVARASVYNWIEAAREGRIDLVLHQEDGKYLIANTTKNKLIIDELVEKGRKKRNARYHNVVSPSAEFYKLYSSAQVADIVANIDTYREVPLKYTYFNGGAEIWDKYTQKLSRESSLNILNATEKLLTTSRNYLDDLLDDSERVNIVDLGPGNAMPAKHLVAHLLDKGILGRYIAIDESEAMLAIAERNLRAWFGDRINFEANVRDLENSQFNDLLVGDYFAHAVDNPINVVLLLGGTATNFRSLNETLRLVRRSMGRSDLFLYVDKLDTPSSRRYFDFDISEDKVEALSPQHRLILDLLNIDESYYNIENIFDEQRSTRSIRIRLKAALSLRFELDGGQRTVDIDKGETILIWRALDLTSSELVKQFEAAGFRALHTSTTKEREYFMIVGGTESTGQ